MESASRYAVSIQRAAPRLIAGVRARVASDRVASEFRRHLDQVYAARAHGIELDGQNVFVYRDASEPGHLEATFGVGARAHFSRVGEVEAVELPVGDVATTTHVGSYAELGAAHAAVVDWCRANSRALAGPRWEVYGHWVEGQTPRTDVYYLLSPL